MRRALLLLLLALPPLPLAAGEDAPAERALAWLADLSDYERGYATNVVEAVARTGRDPQRWPSPGQSAFSQLAPYDGVDGPYYSYLRVAHAAGTSGYDPRDVNGLDYVALVRAGFVGGQSGSATFVNDDAWAILALRAAGVGVEDEQVRSSAVALRATQLPDGGWSHQVGALRSFTDVTGMALAALRASGDEMSRYASAAALLDATYDAATGGHRDRVGGGVNCQSTVWALHGYAALGLAERPESLAYLRRLQHADGGLGTSLQPNGRPTQPNAFCTAEAVPVLAGARYPFPSYAPARIEPAEAHARETVRLHVAAPHDSLALTWRDARLSGLAVTPPAAGTYAYDLRAEGPGVLARGSGALQVHSARPLLGAFPEKVVVHRPSPLVLDVSNASDPDGRIARFEVDWGDGARTNGTRHAYARPGEYRVSVRAIDETGVASHAQSFTAVVPNRAPLVWAPARVVGDRVSGASFVVDATDPDGDAVEGAGARTLRYETLGARSVEVTVRDAFGAEARANVTVEIVNLPPSVALRLPADVVADEEVELLAEAYDADGPAPALSWSIGPRARFPVGTHEVRVVAVDADGARAVATGTLVARLPDAAPAPPAPEVRALDASLEAGVLRVRFDASGETTLRWESDAGAGERRGAASPLAVELPGATWASVTLEAERGGARASAQTARIVARDAGVAAAAPAAEARAPAPVVAHAAAPPEEPTLVRAAFVTPEPARETPGAPALAALALALLLSRRGRRAR